VTRIDERSRRDDDGESSEPTEIILETSLDDEVLELKIGNTYVFCQDPGRHGNDSFLSAV